MYPLLYFHYSFVRLRKYPISNFLCNHSHLLPKELEEHLEWYKTSTEFEQQEWDDGLKIAKRFGTDLNFCHILALSNVLKVRKHSFLFVRTKKRGEERSKEKGRGKKRRVRLKRA
jgi:hypothetical protein